MLGDETPMLAAAPPADTGRTPNFTDAVAVPANPFHTCRLKFR